MAFVTNLGQAVTQKVFATVVPAIS
ncbi:unnamed protein product [Amaranthus hypochondriacus]